MRKQLLAIAIGAASVAPMAAMAEAEVYGRFDVTYQKSESMGIAGSQGTADTTSLNVGSRYNTNDTGDQWELRNNKSRVGVRGSADLDAAGNSAIYQLEMQFNPGVENNGLPNFTLRNTFVGVDNDDFGKVFVGRYDTIVKQAEFSVDQFNNTDADIGNVLLGTQNRVSDTINYHSPKFGPSLQVKAQLIPGESEVYTDTNGESDRESGMADGYGLSIGMEEGNMYGAIAYETAIAQDTQLGVTTEFDTLRVSGGLDGRDFGVGFLWEQVDGDNLADTYGNNSDDARTGWVLSGRFNPTEKVAVKAQYGNSDERVPGVGASNDDDRSVVSATIGADYMLGKSTKVYTFYSMNEVDGKTAGNADDDSEFNVLAFGMQHKF